jgi:hypothetical protein
VALGGAAIWMQRDAISAYLGKQKLMGENPTKLASDKPLPKSNDRLLPDDSGANKSNAPNGVKVVTTQPITPGADPTASATPGGQSDVASQQASPGSPTSAVLPPAVQPGSQATSSASPDTTQPTPLPSGDSLPIAQKVTLLEEAPPGATQPVQSSGKVIWQMVKEPSPQPGAPDITRIRGRIEIPSRGLVLNLTIEPNSDQSLPASHLIKLEFKLPPNFDAKSVARVPGMIMKSSEEATGGDPLVGATARLSGTQFWIALAAPEADRNRNLQLMKSRGWIDIPFVYDTNRRAMLTIEKAGAGDRVFNDAIAAWANGG